MSQEPNQWMSKQPGSSQPLWQPPKTGPAFQVPKQGLPYNVPPVFSNPQPAQQAGFGAPGSEIPTFNVKQVNPQEQMGFKPQGFQAAQTGFRPPGFQAAPTWQQNPIPQDTSYSQPSQVENPSPVYPQAQFGPIASAPKAESRSLTAEEQKFKEALGNETVQRVAIDTDKAKRKQEILVNFDYEIRNSLTGFQTEGETSLGKLKAKQAEISAKKREIEQIKLQLKTDLQRLQQQSVTGLANDFSALGQELQGVSASFSEKMNALASQFVGPLNTEIGGMVASFQQSQQIVYEKFTQVSSKLQQTKQNLSRH